ncbi:Lrp/AsnC ligand binding domain-containing protein [Actinomadura rayongensis]|uniref:AsnC family transcriptional regulator n=1 Tax=Actinomadura rayongensis TaxID=1429076 RepID=A0A6I4WHH4_9ACTN|nr:AsnC family transcriptional regulator [Actinomadura rayongensis]
MRESTGIDEIDLAVVHAVERSPRASWAVIGSLVGIDASTAARRWERLEDAGVAWVTCYPVLVSSLAAAVVALTCAPDAATRVAETIARDPQALFVDVTTGAADVLVTVGADGIAALSSYVLDRLGGTPGVTSVQTHPILVVHAEGNFVGAGSLDSAALHSLPVPEHGRLGGASAAIGDLDRAICDALSRDGRRPVSALARDVDAAEATVRRRLARLTRLGAVRMMVEMATSRTATPLTAWYSARVPGRRRDATARALAALPTVKAVTSVAGPDNIIFKATFRDLADIHTFDTRLNENLPDLETTDRKVVLRPVRIMSRLVDPGGHAREVVSTDVRRPTP